MDYNTVRGNIIIPEYGRNVQKMVDYALSVPDREKRTRIANLIINVMLQLVPSGKDIEDIKHKLWDHLYIISNFKLDVDSPYPMPDKENSGFQENRVGYPKKIVKYRHYGNNIRLIIDKAISCEDEKQKDDLTVAIANQMKKLYLTWNRESVEDDVIALNISEMSDGKLKLNPDIKLTNSIDILSEKNKTNRQFPQNKPGKHGSSKKKKKFKKNF